MLGAFSIIAGAPNTLMEKTKITLAFFKNLLCTQPSFFTPHLLLQLLFRLHHRSSLLLQLPFRSLASQRPW